MKQKAKAGRKPTKRKMAAASARKLERTANERKARPAAEVGPQAFTVPFPIGDNRRMQPVRMGRGVRMILTPEVREYAKAAQAAIQAAGVRLVSGPLTVSLAVYRPSRRPDLTGGIKVLLDALTGAAWIDDSQVEQLFAFKRLDAANPRVEVVVEAAV